MPWRKLRTASINPRRVGRTKARRARAPTNALSFPDCAPIHFPRGDAQGRWQRRGAAGDRRIPLESHRPLFQKVVIIMMHRFIQFGQVPELRTEPGNPDKGIPEIEVLLPVEVYWQVTEMLKELRYARAAGQSTARLYALLKRTLTPHIILERDRLWVKKSGMI